MLRATLLAFAFSLSHAASSVADEGVAVLASDYVAVAQRALLAELDSREGRWDVQPRGQYRDVQVPADVELRARVANAQALPNVAVWMELSAGDRVVRRFPVHFQVSWFKPALVARNRIEARTALSSDMFMVQEVDIAKVRGAAVETVTQLEGKRLKRELDANATLALNQMEDRPPVELGERIDIATRVGRVVVHRTAIAERDGRQGQRINARLLDSDEKLSVTIVGDNKAEVAGDG